MNIIALAIHAATQADITAFLIRLVIVLIVCGIIAFLVSKSILQDPWKQCINFLLIAIPLIYLALFLINFL